jgi:hypothetical protein
MLVNSKRNVKEKMTKEVIRNEWYARLEPQTGNPGSKTGSQRIVVDSKKRPNQSVADLHLPDSSTVGIPRIDTGAQKRPRTIAIAERLMDYVFFEGQSFSCLDFSFGGGSCSFNLSLKNSALYFNRAYASLVIET